MILSSVMINDLLIARVKLYSTNNTRDRCEVSESVCVGCFLQCNWAQQNRSFKKTVSFEVKCTTHNMNIYETIVFIYLRCVYILITSMIIVKSRLSGSLN